MKRIAVIGAGPAGLSAAYELCAHQEIPVILESDPISLGGLSRTGRYRGFCYDIGGHRFFSKNAEIVRLWREFLGEDLLEVRRLSKIYYRGRFFDYPLKPWNALRNLGLSEAVACLADYLKVTLSPRRPVINFEDWVINAVGERLYKIFFKTYKEKVWGMPCHLISKDWAAQRIKGLNLFASLAHSLGWNRKNGPRTLAETFYYPRLGPGMLWERVGQAVERAGGRICMGQQVSRLLRDHHGVHTLVTGSQQHAVDSVISTMPLASLVMGLDPPAPSQVQNAANNLAYRDFLTVILLVEGPPRFPDQWIYVHEPEVKVGRIQSFGNWSPSMAPEPNMQCFGLEYFCFEKDALWSMSDVQLISLATRELVHLGLATSEQVRDGTVARAAKAYPVYDQDYGQQVGIIRRFLEAELPNLQVVGRNGMHRYNNQDHAMLTGIMAARYLLGTGGYNLWQVNGEAEYIENGCVSESFRLVPKLLHQA
ncbi:MAG: NAD(P)/FAD-dependent oxidoreductase [Vulcanimicrobiota bacterium]